MVNDLREMFDKVDGRMGMSRKRIEYIRDKIMDTGVDVSFEEVFDSVEPYEVVRMNLTKVKILQLFSMRCFSNSFVHVVSVLTAEYYVTEEKRWRVLREVLEGDDSLSYNYERKCFVFMDGGGAFCEFGMRSLDSW